MVRMALALVVLVLFALLFSVARMFAKIYDWKLLPAIRRARRKVERAACRRVPNAEVSSSQGATSINPAHLAFCIRTSTDKERDLLRQDSTIYEEFRTALVKSGYPPDAISRVHFGIESQETVDRDFGGSWREAVEMP